MGSRYALYLLVLVKKELQRSDLLPLFPLFQADSASVGTRLQFEYSPEWKQIPSNQFSPLLGGWIKPGQEYIVFLSFIGTGGGFTTWPLLFGTSGGMYPVVGGIVQYPHDDLSLGGTNLPVSAFKAALRAKISAPSYSIIIKIMIIRSKLL